MLLRSLSRAVVKAHNLLSSVIGIIYVGAVIVPGGYHPPRDRCIHYNLFGLTPSRYIGI